MIIIFYFSNNIDGFEYCFIQRRWLICYLGTILGIVSLSKSYLGATNIVEQQKCLKKLVEALIGKISSFSTSDINDIVSCVC